MRFRDDAHASVWWVNELPDPGTPVRLAVDGDQRSERWLGEAELPGHLVHPAPLALARRLADGAASLDVRAASLYGGYLESTFSLAGFTTAAGPLLRACDE